MWPGMQMKKMNSARIVLIVDDEALIRMVAHASFEEAGFEVLEASNGSEALEVLDAHPDVAAVLTDVQMPGDPDGLKLAIQIRTRCPGCAIVVASGRIQPTEQELASNAVFVSKPYSVRGVVATMQELLRSAG